MTVRLPSVLAGLGLSIATNLLVCGTTRADSILPSLSTQSSPLALQTSRSCDGLRDLMVDTVVHQTISPYGYYGYYGYGYGGGAVPAVADRPMAKSADMAPAAPTAAPAPSQAMPAPVQQVNPGPSHYTTTNTHERGVDEADIIKTDGRFVYTVHGSELVIAKTWPVKQTDVASRFTFSTIAPQQLYLHGNQVIVQGYATEASQDWPQGRSRIMVIDVSNRSAPKLSKIVDVEGYSTSSRLIDDQLYLVQMTSAQVPQKLYETAQKIMANVPRTDQQSLRPWEIQGRLAAMLRGKLLGTLSQADLVASLPRVRAGGVTLRMGCDDLYMPPNNTQLGVTTLARISLGSSKADLVGAMVSGGAVYASTDAMYVAAPYYAWNGWGYADYSTQIHKFSLGDDQTRPAYVASGKVPGMILNEFSMSDWKGDLRVATTDWNWNGQQGGNHLFVMRPFGHELRTIGSIRGIAKGERIYAGRLIGDKGYLVTFKQTDPLFTLDLSDPTNPRIAGELKINGFSSYIHPIGDDQLLTIGQDADDNGRVHGLHLQVFDVKDPAHPRRAFHEKVAMDAAYSWSNAQNDHHAFMYDPVTGTLAFPYVETGMTYRSRLAVYHLDRKTGFESLGFIDHSAVIEQTGKALCERSKHDANLRAQYGDYYCNASFQTNMAYSYGVDRSMIVDKYILSMSQAGLEIHTLAGLEVAATLSWDKVAQAAAIAQ